MRPSPVLDRIVDPGRLAAVAASGLLDSEPEAAFDDLTRMAALLVGAPFAFATVVDDKRSFWKSTFGLPDGAPRQNTVEESFCQYVVRSERDLVVTDASTDDRTRDNPSVESMGVRAWAGFPLRGADGEVLGSFCVVDIAPRDWSERDLEVIRTLASAGSREVALRGAMQSERAARVRAESLAHTLQQSLLPPALPVVPGLDIAARFHPAGTGIELVGDFYDLFASGPDRWSFLIGDVCGKGVEAAKVAALARHTVGIAAMRSLDAPEILAWLNETLLARSPAPDVFVTAVYGTLTRESGGFAVNLCCAGHPPPIVRRADGTTSPVDARGPLIGVMPDFAIDDIAFRLAPGDTLVVYTDGVDEARNAGAMFGQPALIDVVASGGSEPPAVSYADDLAQRIERTVVEFSGGVSSDDIAILVIAVPRLSADAAAAVGR